MDPTTTGGVAITKLLGSQTIIAFLSVALGFLILWPKTVREGMVRFVFTAIASIALGPLFVSSVHARWPELFNSGVALASMQGMDLGVLYVIAPLQILAGLPAWWVIGAFVRWFTNRTHKDIGELIKDVQDMLPTRKDG